LAAIIGLLHINNSFPDFFHFTLWPAFAYNSPTPGHKKKPQKNNKKIGKNHRNIYKYRNTEKRQQETEVEIKLAQSVGAGLLFG